jgi:7-cyano-7-deazaguanine reductase
VTDYPRDYSPDLLYAVPRSDARATLGIGDALPFHGEDLWNAWELSWLDASGRPRTAVAELRVAADSPYLIESKSLKLYLNSLASSRFASVDRLRDTIAADLGACANGKVTVQIVMDRNISRFAVSEFEGACIDDAEGKFDRQEVDPRVLQPDKRQRVSETLHSHLLRSNCPITHQPDSGSILIRYSGPRIDRGSLLEYLVSFRNHDEFHEACVERIFVDLKSHCSPDLLTVYARYNRRGGIDINPFRSDFEQTGSNVRLWRQ